MTTADLTPDELAELDTLKATRRRQQPGTEAWYEAHRAFLERHQEIIYNHRRRTQAAPTDGYRPIQEATVALAISAPPWRVKWRVHEEDPCRTQYALVAANAPGERPKRLTWREGPPCETAAAARALVQDYGTRQVVPEEVTP